MASGKNSNQSSGSQQTLEQEEAALQAAENEAAAEQQYLTKILPLSSPILIPPDAKIISQTKVGYDQVKYQWTKGEYNYTSRWHTRTPGAPPEQGDSWVVERHLPGIGAGPNARKGKREILVGDGKWIPKSTWDAAIQARKHGTATQEQKELLDHGHWKA
ncbi:MAG: hypothetical protein Q4D21_09775 [Phascolarctobacterium sp.]|nr:hypothetical protein [Phascolarctobacterium sp.]